jgi:FMN phosphatase YigB (HAD superfamily)
MHNTKVKAIIFDIDGTLYKPLEILDTSLVDYWVKRIAEHKRISYENADVLFRKLKSEYKSSTRVLEVVGLGNSIEIIKQAEKYLFKIMRKQIRRDRELVTLIKKIRATFSLYTLRNGTKTGTRLILTLLGFVNRRQSYRKGFGPFDDILPTAELGVTKPDPIVFKNAIKTIGLHPSEIAIVGDRIEVDLIPAKKMGMKTIWVSWGQDDIYKKEVDFVISSIYDMKEII